MKQIVKIFLVLSTLISCDFKRGNEHNIPLRIPGEFEPQQAIWLGFRSAEDGIDDKSDSLSIEIIKALNPYIPINLIIEHDSLLPEGKTYFLQWDIDTGKINIIVQSPTDIWFRDPGPIFGITPDNRLAIADFKYTNYSNVPPDSISTKAKEQEAIDRNIAERLGIPSIASKVALEGGTFEPNGRGELILCETITLGRNPHLSKKEIELDFHANFGIQKIIWLPTGLTEDPLNMKRIYKNYWGLGTGGHTDEFVRFANDTTILLAWVEEDEVYEHWLHKMNQPILSTSYDILIKSKTLNNQGYKIIKIPVPEPIVTEEIVDSTIWTNKWLAYYQLNHGDTLKWIAASSYLNYIITNEVVIIPAYWKSGKSLKIKEKDQKVVNIFKELYPMRKIIQLDPTQLNFQGGGMHCRYQPEPKI
jgi:agmatine deiminase